MVEAMLAGATRLSNIGLLYTEQVQWASSEPWYSDLTLTDCDYSIPTGSQVEVASPSITFQVRNMLEEKFGNRSAVVNLILDTTEYWSHSFIARDDKVVYNIDHADSGKEYVKIEVNGQRSPCVRKIVFTTKSHETSG